MSSSPDENRATPDGLSPVFSSSCGLVSHGVGSRPPVIFHPDTHACDAFASGRRPGFGNVFLKHYLQNSRQPTRSIGIALSWTASRFELPAEAKKPAQIPRIGANWEASTIYSPTPTASP